jgi:predicted dehydrogenase
MSDTVGVAVVGLDHWYSAFMVLDQIIAEPSMRLVGLADANPEHLEEARVKYSPEMSATDWRRVLNAESVDMVFSFGTTAGNPEVCLEALGRGKPTLCVKPPAMTVDDASRLAAAAEDAGVFWSSFEVSHRMRANSRHLKKLL